MFECKQLCMELLLHLMQESLGFDSVGEFYHGLPFQIKIVKGGGNSFFRTVSYLQTWH